METCNLKPFHEQLAHLLRPLNGSRRMLAVKANRYLEKDNRIDESILDSLSQDQYSPHLTQSRVEALARALKESVVIDFSPDDEISFLRAAEAKITEAEAANEKKHYHGALADAFALNDKQQQEHIQAEKARKALVNSWRRKNPTYLKDRLSFAEMIDDTYRERGRLCALFERVSQEWKRDKKWASKDLHTVMVARIGKKKTPALRWLKTGFMEATQPVSGRTLNTVAAVADSFSLDLEHELKFWKIAAGHDLDFATIAQMATELIEAQDNRDLRRNFMHALHDASGLSKARASELIGVSLGVYQNWLTGIKRIKELDNLHGVIKILLPGFAAEDFDPEEYGQFQNALPAALSGRSKTSNLNEIIKVAKSDKEPAKCLFSALFGRKGITGKSTKFLAESLGKDENYIKNRIYGDLVPDENFARHLAHEAGATEEQTEEIIEIIIGILAPHKLINLVNNGLLDFSKAARSMRERKGLKQLGLEEETAKKLGINAIKSIEGGKAVQGKTAKAHADFFFPEHQRTTDEYYQHICYATGQPSYTPEETIAALKAGELTTLDAYRHLMILIGQTNLGLAKTLKVEPKNLKNQIVRQNLTLEMAQKVIDATGMPKDVIHAFTPFKKGIPKPPSLAV